MPQIVCGRVGSQLVCGHVDPNLASAPATTSVLHPPATTSVLHPPDTNLLPHPPATTLLPHPPATTLHPHPSAPTFTHPSAPILLRTRPPPPCSRTTFLPVPTPQHPIHTHGRWVSIVARGRLDTPVPPPKPTMIRDTIVMPGNTYLVVRYVVDSPGVWCEAPHLVGVGGGRGWRKKCGGRGVEEERWGAGGWRRKGGWEGVEEEGWGAEGEKQGASSWDEHGLKRTCTS